MTLIYREPVVESRRVQHAGALFGLDFSLRVEPCVFTMATRLSPEYQGGYWQFYALSNGGFYMAPDHCSAFAVVCENGFAGKLSADALGVTVCLYAYSHLSFPGAANLAEKCAEQYHLLRDYALSHAEAGAILAAID